MKNSSGKKKKPPSLEKTMKGIEKKYGKNAIMKLGKGPVIAGPSLSTGSYSLDIALGGFGLPFGRIVEIYGPESSGKTTLALHLIANAQGKGFPVAMIDAEHALDPEYSTNIGVDLDNLMVSQPDYGEQALGIVKKLILGSAAKLIVIDSVAALVPKAELEGEMEKETIGLQARLMSRALRQISGLASDREILVVFLNQERDKIGGFSRGGKTTPGGKALKFWASVRIEIKKRQTKKEGKDKKATANWTFAKVVKSKINPPFKMGEFYIVFGKGIVKARELFHWAKKGKVIKRKGSTFKFEGVSGKGEKGFMKAIRGSKKKKKFVKKVREFIKNFL
jgi:recombination protein RecA